MACRHGCKIAQGFPHATLTNERNMVHHGQRTLRGCQLISSLNNIDGLDPSCSEVKNYPAKSKVFKPVTDEALIKNMLVLPSTEQTAAPPPKSGKACYHETFKVTDLPLIMTRHGWDVGAALMNEWFKRKGFFRQPEKIKQKRPFMGYGPENMNNSIVTMDWVLSFDRFKNQLAEVLGYEYNAAGETPLFATRNAKRELIRKFHFSDMLNGNESAYNDRKMSAIYLEEYWQHQYVEMDSVGSKPLLERLQKNCVYDDGDAALGRFSIHIASSGNIKPLYGRSLKTWEVHIQALQIYLKDSYDFDGFQYLGSWSLYASPGLNTHWKKGLVGRLPLIRNCPEDYVVVLNSDFGAHRETTNAGGDFLLFSDVKTIPLKQHYKFTFNETDVVAALKESNR